MRTTNKPSFTPILATAVLFVACVAGCDSDSAPSSSLTGAGEAAPIKVTLSYEPSGTAALSWDRQTRNITAKLQIGGFTPGTVYAVDIHQGRCAAIGDVAIPFPKVVADSAGAISTTLTGELIAPGGLLPGTALSIHPDAGAELGAPPELASASAACAEINAAVLTATLAMAPVGQRPEGWANLKYNPGNKTLIVATSVSGLAPGSVHSQHLGLGTCQAQGAVKYPLTDLAASANGIAYQTTVIQDVNEAPPSSGWYLSVQFGSSAQTSQNGKRTPYAAPIACGDIGKLSSTS